VGAALVTAVAVLALGAAWELVEWTADTALGTSYSQSQQDTLIDLRNDAIAATGGGFVIAAWLLASVARRPPHLRAPRTSVAGGGASRSHHEP
jgi:uncharacterized membrane protein YjdF